MDLEYAENSSTKCNFITCCRAKYGFPDTNHNKAGKYGSYECDTSLDLIISMGEFINKEIKPDVILWTGDSVPHNMWEEKNYKEKIKYLETVTDYFKANFTNTTLYPSMGNHDFERSNL